MEHAPAPHLADLLGPFHAASFAWALACCAYHRSDAEDILQQAYLRIIDGSAVWEGRSAPRTFVFGVIRRCAQEHRRRAAVRAALRGRFLLDLVAPPASVEHETASEAERVRRALRTLSPRQREVLELVAYHELTIEDAAVVLGVSLGSARTHYARGKQRLAALLGDAP